MYYYQITKERREFNEKEYYYYFNEDTNEDIFYQRITDEVYRIMYINTAKGGRKFIMTRDVNRKKLLSIFILSNNNTALIENNKLKTIN